MRKRVLIVAGVVAVLSLIAAAFVIVPAKADNVTDEVGRKSQPVFYNSSNPVGEVNVTVYGQQIDTDNEADLDNQADKQRAVVVVTKKRFALRVAVGVKLQRRIDGEWVTSRSAGPTNTYSASSLRVQTSPPSPFPEGCRRVGYAYRVVADGKVRWANNSLEPFRVVSDTWFASGPCEIS